MRLPCRAHSHSGSSPCAGPGGWTNGTCGAIDKSPATSRQRTNKPGGNCPTQTTQLDIGGLRPEWVRQYRP